MSLPACGPGCGFDGRPRQVMLGDLWRNTSEGDKAPWQQEYLRLKAMHVALFRTNALAGFFCCFPRIARIYHEYSFILADHVSGADHVSHLSPRTRHLSRDTCHATLVMTQLRGAAQVLHAAQNRG